MSVVFWCVINVFAKKKRFHPFNSYRTSDR